MSTNKRKKNDIKRFSCRRVVRSVKFIFWNTNSFFDVKTLGMYDEYERYTIYVVLNNMFLEVAKKTGKKRRDLALKTGKMDKGMEKMVIKLITETIVHETIHAWLYNCISNKASVMFDNISEKYEMWFRV